MYVWKPHNKIGCVAVQKYGLKLYNSVFKRVFLNEISM